MSVKLVEKMLDLSQPAANGQLFFPECRTPEQMRLANGLCRYLELAGSAS